MTILNWSQLVVYIAKVILLLIFVFARLITITLRFRSHSVFFSLFVPWFVLGIVFRKRLFIHMKHRHLRSASLCPICGTAIHSEKALQNHIDVVHGDRQRKYICDLCGKKFTCKSNLTSHLRLTHNEKKERCKFCNEVFKLKQTLYSHIEFS